MSYLGSLLREKYNKQAQILKSSASAQSKPYLKADVRSKKMGYNLGLPGKNYPPTLFLRIRTVTLRP
jgi:hypothetical protein